MFTLGFVAGLIKIRADLEQNPSLTLERREMPAERTVSREHTVSRGRLMGCPHENWQCDG